MQEIPVEQLQIGHFIMLDGARKDYPFMFKSFKIKTNKQIKIIHDMGMKTISYDPSRSKIAAPEIEYTSEIAPELAIDDFLEEETVEETSAEKAAYIEEQKSRKSSLKRSEQAFSKSTEAVKNLMKNMRSQPKESLAAAGDLVGDIVGTVIENHNASVQLVNMKSQDENSYFHIVNVTMLSLIVGRELGLNEAELNHLGVGAMLHTFGHMKIPPQILRKTSSLTDIELRTYRLYPRYGVQLAEHLGVLPKDVIDIIGQHCECVDGSGYPNQLKGNQMSKLSKIVAVTNTYDDYCNNMQNSKLLTPYEAMSYMYSQKKFDTNILSIFINRLGVYPPGTLVKLSDDTIAGVIAINRDDPMNPTLLLYNAEVPKSEAKIIELAETEGLQIKKTIRRNNVPAEILSYLNFGDSMNYYSDPSANR